MSERVSELVRTGMNEGEGKRTFHLRKRGENT